MIRKQAKVYLRHRELLGYDAQLDILELAQCKNLTEEVCRRTEEQKSAAYDKKPPHAQRAVHSVLECYRSVANWSLSSQ